MPGPDFWLYPAGVTGQARAFSTWSEMAGSATEWVTSLDLTDAAQYPAYSRGATAAIAIRASLIDWFTHLESVLTGVSTELCAVAAEAETIDIEQQAELDALDPQTYLGYDTLPGGSGDLVDPEDRVEEDLPVWPPPNGGAAFYCDMGPAYGHLNDLSATLVPDDLLSPSQWIETVLGWLGAQSISEEILQAFGGRWGDLYRFTDTLRGLAQLVDEMRGSLASAVAYLDVLWQGFAANSAQQYFAALLSALEDGAALITDAEGVFRTYVEGIENAAELIAGQIHGFVDAVIFAAVAAALGTATIETAVGGIIGYSAAGLALLRAYMLLYEVRGTLQNIQTIAETIETLADINAPLALFTVTVPVPQMEDAP